MRPSRESKGPYERRKINQKQSARSQPYLEVFRGKDSSGVGSVLEDIVILGLLALLNGGDLLADGDEL